MALLPSVAAAVGRSTMWNTSRLKPGRFVLAALAAMAAVTPLGITAQRWMTYELLHVHGSVLAWSLAMAILAGLAVTTALVVGVPCHLVTRWLGLAGTLRGLVFCGSASALTTAAHGVVAPFATTVFDHAVVPALCLVFFAVLYAFYFRSAESGRPDEDVRTNARLASH